MAGVDYLDTCHGPLAHGTAQPPAELIRWFADELGVDLKLDYDALRRDRRPAA